MSIGKKLGIEVLSPGSRPGIERKLRSYALGALAAICGLVATALSIFISITIDQTQFFEEHVDDLMAVKNAEVLFEDSVGQNRTYILTGDESYLKSARQLEQRIKGSLARFARISHANVTGPVMVSIQKVHTAFRNLSPDLLEMPAGTRLSDVLREYDRRVQPERKMVRGIFSDLATKELLLFDKAEQEAKTARWWGLVILCSGALLCLLSAFVLYRFMLNALAKATQAEDALRVSEALAKHAVVLAGLGVFDHDHRNNTIVWTPEFRKMCDLGDTEKPSLESYLNFIPRAEREAITKAVQRAHDPTGDGSYLSEHTLVTREGALRWVTVKSQTFFEGKGQKRVPVRTIGAMLDMTESKAREERLRQVVDDLAREKIKLERTNRELEQFAAVAAHDLRSPLTSMLGWIGVLRRLVPVGKDEKVDQAIEFIGVNTQKAEALIGDLLEVARVNVSTSKVESVDLNKLVNHVDTVLNPCIKEKQAEIHVGPLPTVRGCSSLLEGLFSNLIRNAITYRHKDRAPKISIECSATPGNYEFTVSDNGMGIEPEYAKRIFEMFYRLHGESEYTGTGIGLAFCKKVVELYGGKIWVDSIPGQGSEFHFTYPERYKGGI
jgi:signal transduction histidine kinase